MAEVVQSHLDPDGVYFSGFGYRYDGRYDSPDFWAGQEGALAFEMFRLDRVIDERGQAVAPAHVFFRGGRV